MVQNTTRPKRHPATHNHLCEHINIRISAGDFSQIKNVTKTTDFLLFCIVDALVLIFHGQFFMFTIETISMQSFRKWYRNHWTTSKNRAFNVSLGDSTDFGSTSRRLRMEQTIKLISFELSLFDKRNEISHTQNFVICTQNQICYLFRMWKQRSKTFSLKSKVCADFYLWEILILFCLALFWINILKCGCLNFEMWCFLQLNRIIVLKLTRLLILWKNVA